MTQAPLIGCLLTHAHIDHTGYLPKLVSAGFRGPIYANAATHELCALLLPDSAHLQEEDAKYAAKKNYTLHKSPAAALHGVAIAGGADAIQGNTEQRSVHDFSPQFSVMPHDAGHILGATSLELTITENGKQTLVVFSGDMGRYDQPIVERPGDSRARGFFALRINLWRQGT